MSKRTRSRPAAGSRPVAAPTSARRPDEHSEWAHGPVAAALNTSIVSVVAAAAICLTGFPPYWSLVIGVVLAATLVIAGSMRRPRKLAPRSLAYRGSAMLVAGVWMWWRTADFTTLGPEATTALALVTIAVAAAVITLAAWRGGHRVLAMAATAATVGAGVAGGIYSAMANITAPLTVTAHLGRDNYPGWLGRTALSVAVIAVIYVVFGTVCANHEDELDARADRALLLRPYGRDMAMMQALLREQLRAPRLVVEQFTRWPNGAGEDYVIDGTADGVTPADIDPHKDTMAAKLNLPLGCGVEAFQGATRGRLVVAVSRINKISDDHRYPTTYRQRSIYNGLPIGVFRDGVEVLLRLRESSAFVFGQKRSGKTTTLYDIAAGILQCTDCMIWVIDFGGGGVALPFLDPYIDGRTKRPAVDWVATTVEEAKLMADLAYAIAVDRKTFYRGRKKKGNTNLLPLDQHVPEIIIMIDEGAEAMGTTASMSYEAGEVRAKLEQIVRVAGDSGVNIVFSGLAATAETIDRMTLSQLAIRIGMRVTEGRELAYGFDGDYNLNPDDVPYQGSGFVKASHGERTRVFKSYLLEPEQMAEIAVATEHWRPPLDDRGIELGGAVYRDRWNRTRHLLKNDDGDILVDTSTQATVLDQPDPGDGRVAAAGAGPIEPTSTRRNPREGVDLDAGRRPFPVHGSMDELLAAADAAGAALDRAAKAAGGPNDGQGEEEEPTDDPRVKAFRQQLDAIDWANPATWPKLPTPSTVEADRNPNGPAVLEALVRHHGPQGVSAKEIKERLPLGGPWGPPIAVSDQTVHNWLAPPPERQPVDWLAPRDVRKPYVHRSWIGDTPNG